MFSFIKKAFSELEHVVWPTPKETRKYMNYTVGAIIFMSIFLAVLGYVFQTSLKALRDANPNKQSIYTMEDDTVTSQDVEDFLQNLNLTGSTTEEAPINSDVQVTPLYDVIPSEENTENQWNIEILNFTPIEPGQEEAPVITPEETNTTSDLAPLITP